jgi:hypothetical protein
MIINHTSILINKNILINIKYSKKMTSSEAKHYLRNTGRSSCTCKYGSVEKLIEEAIRLKKIDEGEE